MDVMIGATGPKHQVASPPVERPYELRRDADTGYCTSYHHDAGCSRYRDRPGTCRAFDCRDDMRIWADFANKIPAPIELTDDPLIQIRKRP
jgi:hypothetical protein